MPEVELPDGTVVDFPDDTPPEVMKSAIQKHLMSVGAERSVGGAMAGAQARSSAPVAALNAADFRRSDEIPSDNPASGAPGGPPADLRALAIPAAASLAAVAPAVIPFAPRAIGAATGGYQGYKRGGIPGAIAGTAAGALRPGLTGVAAGTAEGYEAGGVPGAIVGGAGAAILGTEKGLASVLSFAQKARIAHAVARGGPKAVSAIETVLLESGVAPGTAKAMAAAELSKSASAVGGEVSANLPGVMTPARGIPRIVPKVTSALPAELSQDQLRMVYQLQAMAKQGGTSKAEIIAAAKKVFPDNWKEISDLALKKPMTTMASIRMPAAGSSTLEEQLKRSLSAYQMK